MGNSAKLLLHDFHTGRPVAKKVPGDPGTAWVINDID